MTDRQRELYLARQRRYNASDKGQDRYKRYEESHLRTQHGKYRWIINLNDPNRSKFRTV